MQVMKVKLSSVSALLCLVCFLPNAMAESQVPENAATSLGLYVTASEARSIMETDKSVVLIDARPRPAYYYLGHVRNAYSIPARFWTGKLDKDAGTFTFAGNTRFAEDVSSIVKDKQRKILVMGSSGQSGAVAVERLASAGYKNVYNVTGGFNGWVKEGLPVILKVNPARMHVRPSAD